MDFRLADRCLRARGSPSDAKRQPQNSPQRTPATRGCPSSRRRRIITAMDKSYGSGGAYTLLDDQDALTQQQKPQTVWQSLRSFFLKGSHK